MNADERALVDGDQLGKPRSKPEGEHFRDELRKRVDEADRTEVEEAGRLGFLGEQGDQHLVETLEGFLEICFDYIPASDEEFRCETVGP